MVNASRATTERDHRQAPLPDVHGGGSRGPQALEALGGGRARRSTRDDGWRTAELELRTRELTEQAETLRRTNEELEQFNYITSHDLQEPIRMVSMNMQKLAQGGGRPSIEQQQRYMRYAQEAADRMKLLIEDLLRYNRIHRDQEQLSPAGSLVAVRAAVDNLSEVIAARGAQVTIADLPQVRANPHQLTQLFQNLVEML